LPWQTDGYSFDRFDQSAGRRLLVAAARDVALARLDSRMVGSTASQWCLELGARSSIRRATSTARTASRYGALALTAVSRRESGITGRAKRGGRPPMKLRGNFQPLLSMRIPHWPSLWLGQPSARRRRKIAPTRARRQRVGHGVDCPAPLSRPALQAATGSAARPRGPVHSRPPALRHRPVSPALGDSEILHVCRNHTKGDAEAQRCRGAEKHVGHWSFPPPRLRDSAPLRPLFPGPSLGVPKHTGERCGLGIFPRKWSKVARPQEGSWGN
jgi:hypothetical protein